MLCYEQAAKFYLLIMKPQSKPQASFRDVHSWFSKNFSDPVYIVARRGYYLNSMGRREENDFGIYDDAAFLIAPNIFEPVNFNTDPIKLGWNSGVGKPFAMLKAGEWLFRMGSHKGKNPALRQMTHREAEKLTGSSQDANFAVLRHFAEGDERNYEEAGYYAINIHSGGWSTTSSWGCQTAPPDQYFKWMKKVHDAMMQNGMRTIRYVLTENTPEENP